MGVPFGAQASLFDRRPAGEAAFDAGKRAGMAGENGSAPDGFDPTQWAKGWQAGQEVLAKSHKTKVPITNMSTLRRLYGLAAEIHEVCHQLGVPVIEVNQRSWRSAFLGPVAPPIGAGD